MVRHGLLIAALLVAMPATASHELARIADDQKLLRAFGEMVLRSSPNSGVEVAAFIVRDEAGNLQCQLWPATAQYGSQVYHGFIPQNVVAIVHTHPPSADKRPSPGDIVESRRLGLAIYVLTRSGIYAADPDSGAVVPVIEDQNWISAALR